MATAWHMAWRPCPSVSDGNILGLQLTAPYRATHSRFDTVNLTARTLNIRTLSLHHVKLQVINAREQPVQQLMCNVISWRINSSDDDKNVKRQTRVWYGSVLRHESMA